MSLYDTYIAAEGLDRKAMYIFCAVAQQMRRVHTRETTAVVLVYRNLKSLPDGASEEPVRRFSPAFMTVSMIEQQSLLEKGNLIKLIEEHDSQREFVFHMQAGRHLLRLPGSHQ